MSSVRVNLLPPEVAERQRARRTAAITAGAVVVYALVLGGVYLLKLGAVNDAREDRDQAAERVAQLQAQVAELQQYADLAARLEARNQLLARAMADEVAWARVLNELSLSFPSSSSMLTLSATTTTGEAAVEGATPTTTDAEEVGSITFSGYSVERYAPGVETVLLQLDDVPGFSNPYLGTAGNQERGNTIVTTFEGGVVLNREVFTNRFVNGLTEEGAQ